MSTTSEEDPKKDDADKPKKRKSFSSSAGDKVRAEHRRSGLIKTLVAGALGGAAYGVHRGAEKFLPSETRRALDDTARIFDRLKRTKALSGGKLNPDDVIEAYAQQASRLASSPVAGMEGREFVKMLRTKLPVENKWHPYYSDAHYDAFARGPAYGAAQVIDEKAEEMAKQPHVAERLRKYLSMKWPEKFSDKVNATAAAHGFGPMDVGPSFRESIAYNGTTIPKDQQSAIAKEIISGDRFTKDRIPLLGGFADHYKEVKKNLAGGLMSHSFPSYVGLGYKARGVHKALNTTIPAILGAAGIGVGGYGIYKLIKSLQRTAYEKRMMAKAEREGQDAEETEKAASEPTAEDLMKRPCCGSGCANCPYDPPHQKGNTKVRDSLGKSAAEALGIPDRSDKGDLTKLKPGELLDLIIQEHRARRAGKHFDVRLGDKDKGLYSWATRYGLPDTPGKPRQFHQQPVHTHAYKDFEGEIPSGYGAGTVKKLLDQKVLTTRADEGGISFTGPKGERFRLTKQNGTWLATKAKQLDPPRHEKGHMKRVEPGDVAKLNILSAEPKIDGALHLMRLGADPELLSHRISKRHGGPIVHTERVFGGRPKLDPAKIPAELRGAELMGEVYAQRKGKMLDPEALGGLLNSDLDKAIAKQRAENIKMRLALFGISGSKQPRDEQRRLLGQVADLMPDTLELTPEVKGRDAALSLLANVQAGKHPMTREGIVVHTPEGPRKVKLSEESDAYIRGTFPGTGRLARLGVPGGFTYSIDEKGPIIGRVGSGLSDETRAALSDYIGRVARVRHHGTGRSGAFKKPSFLALHEDYPTKSASAIILTVNKALDAVPTVRRLIGYTRVPDRVRRVNHNVRDLLEVALEHGVNDQQVDHPPAQVMDAFNDTQKAASLPGDLRRAINETHTHPTPGQIEAGNYRKGTLPWNGLTIKIENPEGTTRSGVSKTGKKWSVVMKNTYGYFRNTYGKDGDPVDVFIGPDIDSDVVVVIDQEIDGKFDEHKVVIGCADEESAKKLYLSNYQKGWKCGPTTLMNIQEFKKWLNEGDTRKPVKSAAKHVCTKNTCPGCGAVEQCKCPTPSREKTSNHCYKCMPKCEHDVAVPFNTCDYGCKEPIEKKAATKDEPSAIGKGLGTLFSDFVPFAPSGARRAGAASVMAERIGEDPGMLLKYPMISQILSMAGGGALAGLAAEHTAKPVTTLLAGVAPYLAVQGLKRHKINKIDRSYKEKKRKRLREMDTEGMVGDAVGSHRLGIAQALEAMRTRKLRDIGAISEAGDALPVATSMVGLGPAASLPLTQLIDHLEARRFREKKADWSDQVNAPTIPLYLAAAGAGLGGLVMAGKKLDRDLNDPNVKAMPRDEWDGLLRHVSGRNLLSAEVPGLNNAHFNRARNDEEAKAMLLQYSLHDPKVMRRLLLNPSGSKLIKQVKEHGVANFDPLFGKASIIGHEAGHAKIEHTPGLLQGLQRNLYRYSPVIAPFSAVGSMAAGLASKSPLGGLLAGTGIGLLGGAGMMLPEYMATHHGMKGLETYQGGKWKQDGDWKRQLTALGTYGALNVLPSSAAGLLGGWVGKRRARKKQEEAEREARESADDPDNVVRMDESARNVEKAANLQHQRFQMILRAKQIARQMGADSADRFIVQHTGSYLKPSINQFFNNKDVVAAGIKKGMKGSKILELLKGMQPPPEV